MGDIATYDAGSARLAIVPDASRFKALLEADMRKIRADFKLNVSADTAQARADVERFREAQQRNGMRLPVDVALAQAQADMEAFRARQRANGITVPVHADTKNARAEVESLTKKLADIGPGPLGNAFQFGGGLALLGELPAATTGVAQLAAALQQLAQAGLAVPGIIGGVAASVGTLFLGLSGISEAYDAISKAAASSGKDQASAARTAQSAQNTLRNAVVDETQARKDQARAYQDARRELEDLNLSLRGGQISEQQAVNDALRQRRDLQKDLASGQIKDQIDLQGRLLDIEAADQRVAESHQSNIELQEKLNTENQKGISGNDGVVASNEHVVRSQQAVADAQAGAAAATTNASAAITAANQALAVLGPNAQDVANTLFELKPAFNDLRTSTSQPLLAGVSQEMRDVTGSLLPNLKTGLGSIATALNSNIKALGASLSSDSSKGLLDRILGNTADAQTRVSSFIDPLVHGIGTLTAAGTDALPRIVDDLGHLAERFSNFIDAADKDGRLDKWINEGITGFEHLGSILGNLGTTFTAITKAAGGGEGLLGALDRGTQRLSTFLNSVEGQNKLKEWFEEGRREIQEHIIPLLQALPGFFKGVIDVGTQIANVVVPPIRDVAKLLGDHPALIHAVVDAFLAWKTITGVASLIGDLDKISTLFRVGLPAAAKEGAAATSGALSGALGPLAAIVAGIMIAKPYLEDFADKHLPHPDNAPHGFTGLDLTHSLDNKPSSAPTPPPLPRGSLPPSAIAGTHDSPPAPPKPPPPPGPSQTRQELFDRVAAGQLPGYSIGPNGTIIGPAGQTINVPGFAKGGPTPSGRGPGPTGGYMAEVHPDEWILPPHARDAMGDKALWALTSGRRFDDGGYIDQYGNPVTPGMIPGPSTVAPIAPNPSSGGVLPAVQTAISSIPGPLANIVSMIPQLNQGAQNGQTPGLTPGIAQAGNDPNAQAQQTTNYLAGWGGNLLSGLASTFYTGVLGFFGLQDSILSPSNPWFQDATKSLGIFNNIPGLGGTTGTPQLGQQSMTLGDGSTIQIPTFGTASGTAPGTTAAGPASVAPGGAAFAANPASRANIPLGGSTTDAARNAGLLSTPLYKPGTAFTYGAAAPAGSGVPQAIFDIAAQFGLQPSTDPHGSLHSAGFAFDFRPIGNDQGPEGQKKMDAFAQYISQNLSGQTLELIRKDPLTGQTWGIAGAKDVDKPGDQYQNYFTGGSEGYAGHTDHVHWATDVAPIAVDPATGQPAVPSAAPASSTGLGPTTQAYVGAKYVAGKGWVSPDGSVLPTPGAPPIAPGLPQSPAGQGFGNYASISAYIDAHGGARPSTGGALPTGFDYKGRVDVANAVWQAYNAAGLPPGQWGDFVKLENSEAGWDPSVRNPSSGAYGIAQFLGSGNISTYLGGDPNAPLNVQATGMMAYLKNRYGGSPSEAWQFHLKNNWYDVGGRVPPGVSLVHNATGGDEYILNRPQASATAHALQQAQAILPTPPPRPNFQVPDAKQMQPPPPPPSAQIAPPPAPAPPDQGPPPPPAAAAPITGPAPIGAGQSSDDHLLPAVSTAIQSGFAAAGNAVQTGVSAATLGAGAGMGGGMGGLSISGLFQQAGKIATGIANVGASALVGSVPGSFGDPNLPAGGATLRPTQNVPHTAPLNGVGNNYVFNGIDSRNVVDEIRLKDAQDQQALLATSRG